MFLQIKNRFPSFSMSVSVLAWLSLIVFSYALYQFFWYIPSWLDYRSIADILAIGYYTLALSLFESLLLWGCLLVLAAILPARFLKNRFVSQSTIILWVITGWALLIQSVLNRFPGEIYKYINQWTFKEVIGYIVIVFSLVFFSIWIVSYIMIYRFKKFENFVLALTERVKIFLFVYLALGMFGFIMVIARNISW